MKTFLCEDIFIPDAFVHRLQILYNRIWFFRQISLQQDLVLSPDIFTTGFSSFVRYLYNRIWYSHQISLQQDLVLSQISLQQDLVLSPDIFTTGFGTIIRYLYNRIWYYRQISLQQDLVLSSDVFLKDTCSSCLKSVLFIFSGFTMSDSTER